MTTNEATADRIASVEMETARRAFLVGYFSPYYYGRVAGVLDVCRYGLGMEPWKHQGMTNELNFMMRQSIEKGRFFP